MLIILFNDFPHFRKAKPGGCKVITGEARLYEGSARGKVGDIERRTSKTKGATP
jgi:hypothetical protein